MYKPRMGHFVLSENGYVVSTSLSLSRLPSHLLCIISRASLSMSLSPNGPQSPTGSSPGQSLDNCATEHATRVGPSSQRRCALVGAINQVERSSTMIRAVLLNNGSTSSARGHSALAIGVFVSAVAACRCQRRLCGGALICRRQWEEKKKSLVGCDGRCGAGNLGEEEVAMDASGVSAW